MKKIAILIALILLIVIGLFLFYFNSRARFPEVKNLSTFEKTEFLSTLESPLALGKNAIYAASLLFAWEELRKEVGPIVINDDSFKDLKLINESKSFIDTLSNGEYKTSIEINKNEIIARAEFSKSLAFEQEFEKMNDGLNFENEKVKAFGMKKNSRGLAEILYYEDENHFILKLVPKDSEHEIILFKSYPMTSSTFAFMIEMVATKINIGKKEKLEEEKSEAEYLSRYEINYGDEISIPKIKFNIEHDYLNLVNNRFKGKSSDYSIAVAYQKTAFKLDEKGAEVESQSVFAVKSAMPSKQTRLLRFDKPFLILLKRVENKNPYFAMWVANAELMEKE